MKYEERAYLEEVKARVRGALSTTGSAPSVEIRGDYPDARIEITSTSRAASFPVWDEDLNDLDAWERPEFVAGEIFRYYHAGDSGEDW